MLPEPDPLTEARSRLRNVSGAIHVVEALWDREAFDDWCIDLVAASDGLTFVQPLYTESWLWRLTPGAAGRAGEEGLLVQATAVQAALAEQTGTRLRGPHRAPDDQALRWCDESAYGSPAARTPIGRT